MDIYRSLIEFREWTLIPSNINSVGIMEQEPHVSFKDSSKLCRCFQTFLRRFPVCLLVYFFCPYSFVCLFISSLLQLSLFILKTTIFHTNDGYKHHWVSQLNTHSVKQTSDTVFVSLFHTAACLHHVSVSNPNNCTSRQVAYAHRGRECLAHVSLVRNQ
jgi:hypothetical protein